MVSHRALGGKSSTSDRAAQIVLGVAMATRELRTAELENGFHLRGRLSLRQQMPGDPHFNLERVLSLRVSRTRGIERASSPLRNAHTVQAEPPPDASIPHTRGSSSSVSTFRLCASVTRWMRVGQAVLSPAL